MFLEYLYLALIALLPICVTVIIHFLDKYTKFKNLPYWPRQILFGIIFGGIAILGTHFGIPINGAKANARDAAVIIGGLIFGGPTGIIAGTIGGVERLIVGLIPSFNLGFTMIACSVSTFLAGVISAIIRHFIFDEKRPGILSSFFIGFVVEVFHLLMVFVTNASDYKEAFRVVKACTPPMLVANSLSVLIALIVINVLEKGKTAFKKPDAKTLNSKVITTLSGLTFIAFVLSTLFVYLFDDSMAAITRDKNLEYAIAETANEVSYQTIDEAYNIRRTLTSNPDLEAYKNDDPTQDTYYYRLSKLASAHGIAEINIIKLVPEEITLEDGTKTTIISGYIERSSVKDYADNHFKMNGENTETDDYTQSKDFHEHMIDPNGPGYYVQDFRTPVKPTGEEEEERKYAGVGDFEFDFEDGDGKVSAYIQVGYNQAGVDALVKNVAFFKNVGNTGSLLILNQNFETISEGKNVNLPSDRTKLVKAIQDNEAKNTFRFEMGSIEYFGQYQYEDTHYIVSILPVEEGQLSRDISVFVNTFLEIIVFGLFFVTVYFLLRKLVLERIEKTNESLAKITAGDLDVVLDGGNVTEFKVLAEDINETVDALKGYIDAANKRIDEELALAKAIQSAVLPSTFPAFPDHKEFDVFASMHPAKEVGGDFYDFYFSNSKTFHVTIADVSGKGIPAALFMMRAKSILKSLTQTNIPINEAFIEGNNSLCEGNEAGMFVTAWSSSIDLDNGVLNFANGGHNPPLIKHKNGEFEYIQAPVNLVLAAMSDMPYLKNEIKLQPGDTIYLYTDGVTEGINLEGEQLGEKRLKDILNAKKFDTCQELCEYVYDECVKFANGATQFDDITMLAFTYKGK